MSIIEGTETVIKLAGTIERMVPKIERAVQEAGEASARLSAESTDLGLVQSGRNTPSPSVRLDGLGVNAPVVLPVGDADRAMRTIGTRAERQSGTSAVVKADTTETPVIANVSSERRGALGSATGDPRGNRFRVIDGSTGSEGPVVTAASKAERGVDALWRMLTPIDGRPPNEGGIWSFDQPRLYGLPDGKGTVSLRKVEVEAHPNGEVKVGLTLANRTHVDGADGMVTSIELRDSDSETKLTYSELGQHRLTTSIGKRSRGGLGSSPEPTAFEPTILAPSAQPWGMATRPVDGPSSRLVIRGSAYDRQYQYDNPVPLETSFGQFLTSERVWGRTDASGGSLVQADGSVVNLEEGPGGRLYSPTGQEFPPVVHELWQHPMLRPTQVMKGSSVPAPDGARLIRNLGYFEELHAPSGAILRENSIPILTNGLWVHAHLNVPSTAQLFHSRTGIFNPSKLRPETIVNYPDGSSRVILGHLHRNSELDDLLKSLKVAE